MKGVVLRRYSKVRPVPRHDPPRPGPPRPAPLRPAPADRGGVRGVQMEYFRPAHLHPASKLAKTLFLESLMPRGKEMAECNKHAAATIRAMRRLRDPTRDGTALSYLSFDSSSTKQKIIFGKCIPHIELEGK